MPTHRPVTDALHALIGPFEDLDDKTRALAEVALVIAGHLDLFGTESKDVPRLAHEYTALLDRIAPEGDEPDVVAGLGDPT